MARDAPLDLAASAWAAETGPANRAFMRGATFTSSLAAGPFNRAGKPLCHPHKTATNARLGARRHGKSKLTGAVENATGSHWFDSTIPAFDGRWPLDRIRKIKTKIAVAQLTHISRVPRNSDIFTA